MGDFLKFAIGAVIWSFASAAFTFIVMLFGARCFTLVSIEMETWRLFAMLVACNMFLTFMLIKLNKG